MAEKHAFCKLEHSVKHMQTEYKKQHEQLQREEEQNLMHLQHLENMTKLLLQNAQAASHQGQDSIAQQVEYMFQVCNACY